MQELFLIFFKPFFAPEICSGFTRLYQDRKTNATLFLIFFKLFLPLFLPLKIAHVCALVSRPENKCNTVFWIFFVEFFAPENAAPDSRRA
jgi:hypothetical protein